ncbi:hypothetical protein D3C86_1379990 [compost metagenome]
MNLSGIIIPIESDLIRTFSSTLIFLQSKNSSMSAWKIFKYTAPAPGRCPNWLAYENVSSMIFMMGRTPPARPSTPLIASPRARIFEILNETPPPIDDNFIAESTA